MTSDNSRLKTQSTGKRAVFLVIHVHEPLMLALRARGLTVGASIDAPNSSEHKLFPDTKYVISKIQNAYKNEKDARKLRATSPLEQAKLESMIRLGKIKDKHIETATRRRNSTVNS